MSNKHEQLRFPCLQRHSVVYIVLFVINDEIFTCEHDLEFHCLFLSLAEDIVCSAVIVVDDDVALSLLFAITNIEAL